MLFKLGFSSGWVPAWDPVPDVRKLSIPLTYLAGLLRQALTGYPAMFPIWLNLAVLGGVRVTCAAAALRNWRWK